MNSNNFHALSLYCRRVAAAVFALATPLGTAPVCGQLVNFDSQSAPGFVHYDVGTIGALYGISGLGASYTFPSDGNGSYGYRINAPPDSPYDQPQYGFGPARAMSYRADTSYTTRFAMGVDVVAWNSGIDQAFGGCWFIQTPGPGTTTGYSLTWEATASELLISRVAFEQATYLGRRQNVNLQPGHRYRFTASSHDGTTFLGQLFDSADPNTPLAGVLASDGSYGSGVSGLMVYETSSPSTTGADATFDNYNAFAPAAGALRATVAHMSPAPNDKTTQVYPTNVVVILNRDTTVDTSSVLLWLDGTLASSESVSVTDGITEDQNPNGMPTLFSGATVMYVLPELLPTGSRHTNTIAFRDNTGFWQTNAWPWVIDYPYLRASNSLPLGSFPLRGFSVKTVWTNGPGLGNSLSRAEQQLAVPPRIPALINTQTVAQVLNWNDAGDGTTAQLFGYFFDPALASGVPGLAPDGSHDNIACEIFAYIELSAGLHRFGVKSDDGFQLCSGSGTVDLAGTVLGERVDGSFDGVFDCMVEADGLYPVRGVWYENTGSAFFQFFTVELFDPNLRTLVNDPNNPAGEVKAYVPLRLLAATAAAGPYDTETSAVIDTGTQTVTVPAAGPARFYRLQAPYPVTLRSISQVGNALLIHYQ